MLYGNPLAERIDASHRSTSPSSNSTFSRTTSSPRHNKQMSDSSSSSAPLVKRACDCCHRRKVKCIGDQPCKNCVAAQLKCTYLAIPQKKGPKGSRAKVISQLREKQEQQKVSSRLADGDALTSPERIYDASLLPNELISICVDYFFSNLYPTQPILHRRQIADAMAQIEDNPDAFCLLASLCGYMLIQPNLKISARSLSTHIAPSGHTLIQETLRVRRHLNYIEAPTVWSVITSFFLFGSYFCLDKHNTAWFFLREATTLAQIIGMHEEANYRSADWVLDTRKRRLYWLLFVTERAYALQQHRPLTLHPTINPPTLNEDTSEELELSGFIHLVNLFRPFDDTFVGLWNRARAGCTTEFLAQLQHQLSLALPLQLHSTESQAVDLRCSQQWLRTMVWQLSISQGLLSSTTADKAMSFQFPIDVSRDLVSATSHFSQNAMEVHGIGLIEKLFDVACTLTDVMACVPIEQHTFEYRPSDYLNQLLSLISTLRGGKERYLPLLMTKIGDTIPTAPDYGYQISAPLSLSRVEELQDSQDAPSTSDASLSSSSTTPLGSPTSANGETFALDYHDLGYAVTSQPYQVPFSITSDPVYVQAMPRSDFAPQDAESTGVTVHTSSPTMLQGG